MRRVSNEFRFKAGRLALNLPATVRHRASQPNDVLEPPGAPARWLRDAGLVENLLNLSNAECHEITKLREAIWVIFDDYLAGRPLSPAAVGALNKAALHRLAIPQLDAGTSTVRMTADDPFRTALAMVARDAIDLIGGPLKERVKTCARDD
jgi:predicted RNA-binding Zn ribbon-like protein